MKRFMFIALFIVILSSACGAAPTPIPDTLFVDPGTDLGPDQPLLVWNQLRTYACCCTSGDATG